MTLVQNQQAFVDQILPAAHAFKAAVEDALKAANDPSKNTSMTALRELLEAFRTARTNLLQVSGVNGNLRLIDNTFVQQADGSACPPDIIQL